MWDLLELSYFYYRTIYFRRFFDRCIATCFVGPHNYLEKIIFPVEFIAIFLLVLEGRLEKNSRACSVRNIK